MIIIVVIIIIGIAQSIVSFDGINVCSSWSTSIWVSLLGIPKQHFWSSLFIVTSAVAGQSY